MWIGDIIKLVTTTNKVASDSFNRADSAASLGNADTGQAWIVRSGTWGISSNAARLVVNSVSADAALIDSGISNVRVKVTFSIFSVVQRLEFRSTDVDNRFIVTVSTNYVLYRVQAGALTTLGTYNSAPANGDIVEVVANGSSIIVNINGVQRISVTDSFNQTATKHGLSANNASCRYDDFSIETV